MSILIVVLEIASLTRMPVRELPDASTAEATVSVSYTGAGPAVVDNELASVIEGAISTVAGIDRMSTESELGGAHRHVMDALPAAPLATGPERGSGVSSSCRSRAPQGRRWG